MRLTVIGCSPAWPNPGQAHAGLLVEGAGSVLLDCGPGVLSVLRARAAGWPHVDAIVLSHLHLDHCGDVIGWLWGGVAGAAKGLPLPELWVAADQREALVKLAAALGDFGMLARTFPVRTYTPGEPARVAGFELTAIPMEHYTMPTCGLRLTDPGSGAALAYSADTGPTEALVRLARNADLLVCEATLPDGAEEGELRGHLSAAEAVAAFTASRAKRLLLTHRPVELPAPAGVEMATPGLVIDL